MLSFIVKRINGGTFIMVYAKHTWETGEIVSATKMNNIESGIKGNNDFLNTGNAGFHNSIYRGKSLGTAVTDAQWSAISAGTFDDMFIGDYWTINGMRWVIAHFDYYYNIGDTNFGTHHVCVVPYTNLYNHVMNTTNTTEGGYEGSNMRTEGLAQAIQTVKNAFGEAHLKSHRLYLCNAVTDGVETGGEWTDSPGVELMTEIQVYGTKIRALANHIATVDKEQLALFALEPKELNRRLNYWLQDAVSSAYFAAVYAYGIAGGYYASYAAHGVRPLSIIG